MRVDALAVPTSLIGALPASLVPALAVAQPAAQAGDPGTPLLWLWVLVGLGLLATLLVLLFSPAARERGRARRAAGRVRQHLQERT